jgi:hypothetical protein
MNWLFESVVETFLEKKGLSYLISIVPSIFTPLLEKWVEEDLSDDLKSKIATVIRTIDYGIDYFDKAKLVLEALADPKVKVTKGTEAWDTLQELITYKTPEELR